MHVPETPPTCCRVLPAEPACGSGCRVRGGTLLELSDLIQHQGRPSSLAWSLRTSRPILWHRPSLSERLTASNAEAVRAISSLRVVASLVEKLSPVAFRSPAQGRPKNAELRPSRTLLPRDLDRRPPQVLRPRIASRRTVLLGTRASPLSQLPYRPSRRGPFGPLEKLGTPSGVRSRYHSSLTKRYQLFSALYLALCYYLVI